MEEHDYPPASVCGNQITDTLPSQNQVSKDDAQEERHARALKMFKDVMLKLSLSQNPSLPRSRSCKKLLAERIDRCLPSLLPSPLHTPNHPPYSLMIITALGVLTKKRGTKKGSISSFIKSNYQDLPLAHEHLLTHHLENLVSIGEVIAVNKSLYALPGGNAYTEEQQQIVEQGETVEGETCEDDIGGGVLLALPAVVEPVAIDESGDGLISVCDKNAHDLPALNSMGGDDVNGHELENFVVVNEAVAPLQRKIPGRGRGMRSRKKVEDKQPHERLDEVVGPVSMKGFCGGLVSLPEKDPSTLTELQSMPGGLVTDSGPKHSENVSEAVVRLHKMWPKRGLRRLPEKKNDNEHQQNKMAEVPGLLYAENFDNPFMSSTEKHQATLIEHETVNCDDDSCGGAKHLSARIGEVESLPGFGRGNFSKDSFKDEKAHKVVEGVESLKEDDFGGVCISLSEKLAPSLVEQALISGDVGLMSVCEKHAHDMAELNPIGGDDVNGNGLENSEAVNEEVVPLQIEFPQCGRGPEPNKKMEDEQLQIRVDEVVGPVPPNGFCGVLVSLSEEDRPTLTEPRSMGGDVVTGVGLKNSEAIFEAVNPLQSVLPICGIRGLPEKKNENEHQRNETVEALGQVHTDDLDGRLMPLTEKHPSSLIEHDSVNCDDLSSVGAMHLSSGIEEVESPGLNGGNFPKHALNDEKMHNNVAEGVEILEKEDFPGGSISLSEKHEQSLVEQALIGGDVCTGGGSKDSLVEAVETLPREKTEAHQRQNEVADLVEPPDDNEDCDCSSVIPVTKKHPLALTEVQSMSADMHIGGGLKTSAAAPLDLLQKIMPVRQSWRLKRKYEEEQQQKEVVNSTEKIPSMTIVDAAKNDSEEDLAVENDSQEKKQRRLGRPPKRKSNRKQQKPVSREKNLAVRNDSQVKQPGRPGRPPTKKNNRKQQEPVRAIIC